MVLWQRGHHYCHRTRNDKEGRLSVYITPRALLILLHQPGRVLLNPQLFMSQRRSADGLNRFVGCIECFQPRDTSVKPEPASKKRKQCPRFAAAAESKKHTVEPNEGVNGLGDVEVKGEGGEGGEGCGEWRTRLHLRLEEEGEKEVEEEEKECAVVSYLPAPAPAPAPSPSPSPAPAPPAAPAPAPAPKRGGRRT